MAFDAEILIAGAGPVGLLLANLLGRAGIATLVLEKRETWAGTSRAISITQTSLRIMAELDLAERFLQEGLPARKAVLHTGRGVLTCLELRPTPNHYPFILSIPQYRTEQILRESLARFPAVRLWTGREVRALSDDENGVRVEAAGASQAGRTVFRARFLCACDGDSSTVRRLLGVERGSRTYPVPFLMGDYRDRSGLADEAHLYFTREGAVESFPVGAGMRRWIVQAEAPAGGQCGSQPELLERLLERRIGFRPDPRDLVWRSSFQPQRAENRRYVAGNVIFCGDAAHTMPPIGGHGMNSGFGDAHLLARVLELALRGGAPPRRLLDAYSRYRQRAFRSTAHRSWLLMRLGTARTPAFRWLRDLVFRLMLLPPLREVMIRHFAMLNIPYSTLNKAVRRDPALRAG
jgi:2-polyprenyl-6-methoxyphenol hydroxylase-like FAD-dependent oxidoreductase